MSNEETQNTSAEQSPNMSALITLGTQGQTVADPAQDVRGRKVQDKDGAEIGKVTDLLIDTEQRKVRFLKVEHGGFLGLGRKSSFIPVDAVSAVGADVVTIHQSGEHVAAAPGYDPDLEDEQGYYGNLSGYYGYQPYWGMGYLYPGYPSYGADPYGAAAPSSPATDTQAADVLGTATEESRRPGLASRLEDTTGRPDDGHAGRSPTIQPARPLLSAAPTGPAKAGEAGALTSRTPSPRVPSRPPCCHGVGESEGGAGPGGDAGAFDHVKDVEPARC